MKKLFSSIILSGLVIGTTLANAEGDKKNSGKETGDSKRTVLIVGLKDENITSNYFMAENIAERTSLAKDSLGAAFSRFLSEGIEDTGNSRFEFVSLSQSKENKDLLSKVQFKNEKDMVVSDLSGIQKADFQKLLNEYKADYVILLDRYYLKFEDGINLFHILNYDVYNRDQQNIAAGKTYFNSTELLPLVNYEKKYKKAGAKIVDQLEKVTK